MCQTNVSKSSDCIHFYGKELRVDTDVTRLQDRVPASFINLLTRYVINTNFDRMQLC